MDMPTYPGDPTTPGRGSIPGVSRLDVKDVTTLTRIPVLPISYGDAQPLLAALTGAPAPNDWRGGLPITYRIGPGPAQVHVRLAFDWSLKRAYNVIARLTGTAYPDEWIIRGNHHDAWVNGAQDPASGMAPALEEARALGQLTKQGWRPQRTIVYAAWDGEEQGLLGSTEWVEQHEAELRDKAAVYINTDGNGRGFLSVGGSHALESLVNAVAKDVEDPETKGSVWKRMQALAVLVGPPPSRAEARSRPDLRISALGSGSDYSAFLQHTGIPTLNLSFGGLDPSDGVYHSIYDDYYHYTKFLDTDFAYGRALAQTVGSLVVRLADADVLPFQFTNLADTAQTYVNELQAFLRDRQNEVKERNQQIEDGVFTAVADPRRKLLAPVVESVPPSINFSPLENAASALTQAADRYRKALDASRPRLTPDAIRALNKGLIQSERQLTDDSGLPRRPWYRHLLYAPGFYTGYAVKTMPGVREALEQREYAEAEREVVRVAGALTREAELLDGLTRTLEQLAKQ
jgi:N-acetylated-alpha-linked acidic dipeptidase